LGTSRGVNRGKEWERQVARDIGKDAKRKLEDRAGAGYDIVTDLPLKIQCKHGKQPSVHKAIEESSDACQEDEVGDIPVGAVKWLQSKKKDPENGRQARRLAVLRWADLVELINTLKAEGIW